MLNVLKKIYTITYEDIRERGLYYTITMNIVYLISILRGMFYKIIYFKNIKASIFSLQSKSTIDVFSKKSMINIGKFVFIRKNTSIRIDGNSELTIGDKVFINDNCNINCAHRIVIGKCTKIAPNVCINDHDHNYKGIGTDNLLKNEVVIGENVWIGSNVVILRGSNIGDNSVIGAGSIVKGEVPPNSVFINKRESITLNYKNKNII